MPQCNLHILTIWCYQWKSVRKRVYLIRSSDKKKRETKEKIINHCVITKYYRPVEYF